MTYPKSALSELKIVMSYLMRWDICFFACFCRGRFHCCVELVDLARQTPTILVLCLGGSIQQNHQERLEDELCGFLVTWTMHS